MGQLNSSRSGKPGIAMSWMGQETGFGISQRHVRTARERVATEDA
jgi:hypothetical protein